MVLVIAQSLSHVWLCHLMDSSTSGSSVLHYHPEFAQIHVRCVGDAIWTSHPLPPRSPPILNLSHHQCLFQWVSSLHQVLKLLELQLQHRPSNNYTGLISFRIDCLDLLAVQGTLKSLPQHHSSKVSILSCSAFFIVQLSHDTWNNGLAWLLVKPSVHDYW